MLSVSPAVADVRHAATASLAKLAELVRKIETSATPSHRRRKSAARKKLLRVIKQQGVLAKKRSLQAVCMTLTYSSNEDFAAKNISDFLAKIRQVLKRRGEKLLYAWVLEQASRLHYHLILWLPRNFWIDADRLKRWWGWGSTWFAACRSVKKWERYMAKFEPRSVQMQGARLFGYGGLDDEAKAEVARTGMPRWLLDVLPRGQLARRSPGGGWANIVTGEIYKSPYVWTPRGCVQRSLLPPVDVGMACLAICAGS